MVLLFDIGGTNMRFAVSQNKEGIERKITIPTPQQYAGVLDATKKVVEEVCDGSAPKKAAGCIAGAFNKTKTHLEWSPNLRGWEGKPILDDLTSLCGVSPIIENDADTAGLGEARFGAGKKHGIVVYMTISTGIGGTRIVNGQIDQSAFGFEPGHQIVQEEKTLEELASGTGFANRFGGRPENMEEEQHDALWDETAMVLARGIRNTALHWSPHVVVLGGSLILKSRRSLFQRVVSYVEQEMKEFPFSFDMEKAALGEDAGLWGSLALLS